MLADTTGRKPYARRAVAQQHQHQQSSSPHLPPVDQKHGQKNKRKRRSPRQHLEPCPNRRDQLGGAPRPTPERQCLGNGNPIRTASSLPPSRASSPRQHKMTPLPALTVESHHPGRPITPAQPQRRSCIMVCNRQRSRPFALRSGPAVPVPTSQTKTQAPLPRFQPPDTNAPQNPSLRTPPAPEASSNDGLVLSPPLSRCLVTPLVPRDMFSRRNPPPPPSLAVPYISCPPPSPSASPPLHNYRRIDGTGRDPLRLIPRNLPS